jgi:hypothetical protein
MATWHHNALVEDSESPFTVCTWSFGLVTDKLTGGSNSVIGSGIRSDEGGPDGSVAKV